MAKHELSSTLKNLKFMQRAIQREEKIKQEEEVVAKDENFSPAGALRRKCVVIMEGDPHPGAIKGRMSFQNFNPSIDKLNEEIANPSQPEAFATFADQNGRTSDRENGSFEQVGAEGLNTVKTRSDFEDHKRKQSDGLSEVCSNKSPKRVHVDGQSSPSSSRSSRKQRKHEKLDWSVLKPPNCQSGAE